MAIPRRLLAKQIGWLLLLAAIDLVARQAERRHHIFQRAREAYADKVVRLDQVHRAHGFARARGPRQANDVPLMHVSIPPSCEEA